MGEPLKEEIYAAQFAGLEKYFEEFVSEQYDYGYLITATF